MRTRFLLYPGQSTVGVIFQFFFLQLIDNKKIKEFAFLDFEIMTKANAIKQPTFTQPQINNNIITRGNESQSNVNHQG